MEKDRTSVFPRLPLAGRVIAVAILLAMASGGWLAYRQLQAIEQTLQVHPEALAIWDIVQLQRQLLHLANAVDSAVASGRVADEGEARLALDLVLSRVNTLTRGDLGEAVARLPPRSHRLPGIIARVRAIERNFPAFLRNPRALAPQVQGPLGEAIPLSQESLSIVYNLLLSRGEALRGFLEQVQMAAIVIDLIFILLIALLIFILWQAMRSRLREVFGLVQELRHSEERFRLLVEVSIQGIVVHRDFRVLYANEAIAHILRLEPGCRVADLSIHEFVHPEERERIAALYAARMRDEAAPGRYELRLLSRNGDTIWSDIQVRKIDWDGEAAVMATFMDITDLKQAAEELRRAKESSEAANEAKTRFLARMSHELRTPLTSVIGFAQLILRGIYGEPSPPVRDAVEEIDASGQHLLAIINDLLDISRIEAGRMVLRLEAHSPAECLQRVTRQLHALAEEKGLRLELEGEAPPLWRFDPQRITQVLLNLVGNAIKFTRQGTIRVGARTEGGELLYWVADTGIGISGNELERMFQEFQQADSSLTREEQGTGLGLAIAKGIVENHGGKIWAESRVDVGSTFWFTLPPREGSG